MRAKLLIALLASGCVASPQDSRVGSSSEAATVCAAGATLKGIDVSSYQGTINWSSVAGDGIKFAITKATEGTGYLDPTFSANWSGMKNAGVMRSAYHFFRSNLDAKAQADYFLNAVGALGPNDLPPMLDLETSDGESASTIASKALVWLQTVEQATGKKPIVYTYVSFWQNTLGQPSGFTGYPLNIANYGVSCPDVVGSWPTWTMWQHTDAGSVKGVSGGVDSDYFNGDEAALMKLANGSGGTPPANPCIGLSDGSYCGGDGLTGDKDTLYVCKGGAVSSQTKCAGGCKYNPPGVPDACNPAPPSPDGGAGGGGSDGGSGGGGGAGDTGSGAGSGAGAGAGSGTPPGGMGVQSSGCAMTGSPAGDGVALLAMIGLLLLALRRRARA